MGGDVAQIIINSIQSRMPCLNYKRSWEVLTLKNSQSTASPSSLPNEAVPRRGGHKVHNILQEVDAAYGMRLCKAPEYFAVWHAQVVQVCSAGSRLYRKAMPLRRSLLLPKASGMHRDESWNASASTAWQVQNSGGRFALHSLRCLFEPFC